MFMTVAPHDLGALCKMCNTTLKELSLESGLSEETLTAFAEGRLALSAEDRACIINVLASHGKCRSEEDDRQAEGQKRMREREPARKSFETAVPLDVTDLMVTVSRLKLASELEEEQRARRKKRRWLDFH